MHVCCVWTLLHELHRLSVTLQRRTTASGTLQWTCPQKDKARLYSTPWIQIPWDTSQTRLAQTALVKYNGHPGTAEVFPEYRLQRNTERFGWGESLIRKRHVLYALSDILWTFQFRSLDLIVRIDRIPSGIQVHWCMHFWQCIENDQHTIRTRKERMTHEDHEEGFAGW